MNASNGAQGHTGDPLDIGVAIFNALTFPVTAVGNLLLLFTLYKDPLKCFRNFPSYVLGAMASANVCTGLLTQPLVATAHVMLYLGKGLEAFEGFIKPTVRSSSLLALNVSYFNLLALAVDNYMAISRPFRYRAFSTLFKAKVWIACSLAYSTVFAFIHYVGLSKKLVSQLDLHLNSTLVSLLLLTSYGLLCKSFYTQAKESIRLTEGQVQAQNRRLSIMERKFQKMLFLFVLFFTIPAVLSTINWYIILYCAECKRRFPVGFRVVQRVLHNFVFLKPMADSFVFAWRIPKYREALRNSCRCSCSIAAPPAPAEETKGSVITLAIRFLDGEASTERRAERTSSL